jgi:hypothetical protein
VAPSAAKPAPPAPAAALPAAVGTVTARDPFHPLFDVTPASKAAAPATGASAGTAKAPGGGGSAGQKVTLVGIAAKGGAKTVNVDVDGKRYQARTGQSFATSYKVVDIGTSCADFLFGDSAFTLCKGEAILK